MFTGNDPSQDTVVRSNQTVFGGTFLEIRTALHYINNGGQIVFAMTEVDGSGNPTTHIVRADPLPADNTPPDTTITSSPGAVTNSTSAIFSFTSTEAGSTFACRLDGSAFTACTSPQSYSSLAPGSHTFQVRAIDAANNTDQTPASFTWIIDITPPDTTITSNPPATNSTSASFSFTSTEAGSTFECSLDGASFTSCTNPQNYTNLANSSHTFLVRATDPAGNTDPTPASHTWTVDTVPSAGFFLHGSGATANPSNLFLNGNSPTATTAKSKDSVGIKFSGGNPWTQIGTWTAQPALSSGTLSALGSLRTWIGLKNSDDQGTWYDLRAEVYKNSTLVASGEIFCIQGVTRNPDQAKEVAISFNSPPPMTFNGTDVLSLKILTRIGTNGSGAFCGGHSNAVGLRLYFDAVSRPSKLTATFSE